MIPRHFYYNDYRYRFLAGCLTRGGYVCQKKKDRVWVFSI